MRWTPGRAATRGTNKTDRSNTRAVRKALAGCALLFLLVLTQLRGSTAGDEFYVSTTGSPAGNGSHASPWDLQTALNQPAAVTPGSTVWVKGGLYRGTFVSRLRGTASAPITVRNYQGQRVTLDNTTDCSNYTIAGDHSWHWGLEITSSGTKRRTVYSGTDCGDAARTPHLDRGLGVRNNASFTKLINMVIHDTQMGVSHWGTWEGPLTLEAYGNLLYYNGAHQQNTWGDDRGQGHGFYTTSKPNGPTRLIDNIVHSQFSQGIRVGDDGVFNPHIEGNIAYSNGEFIPAMGGRNIYVGGSNDQGRADYYQPMTGAVIRSNYTYYRRNSQSPAPGSPGASEGMNIGLWWPGASGEIVDNYLAGFGGGHALQLGYWDNFNTTRCAGNTLHGGHPLYGLVSAYARQRCPEPSNRVLPAEPTSNAVFVRPNRYETGRAHIAVYNWQQLASVSVNLGASGLSQGQSYEVRDAMNYFGLPVASGVFSSAASTVSIPMRGLQRAAMAGESDLTAESRALLAHTAPFFGAFVVVPTATPTSPSAYVPPVGATVRYLSDLPWVSAVNGYGPVEKDRSNGEDAAGDGQSLTLEGVAYPKGLGAHAPSDIRYALPVGCSRFQALVGVDDEVGPRGSVEFELWSDGVKVFDSGVVTGASAAQSLSIDVTGRHELRLIMTDAGDDIGYDHGDWADARLVCEPATTEPPVRPPTPGPIPQPLEVCGDSVDNDGDGQIDEGCPVACAVSTWSSWQPSTQWSACAAGVQSRTEARARSIVTAPAHGGAACPALQESRTVTRSCEMPPSEICSDGIDNDLDGSVDEGCAPPVATAPGAPTRFSAKVSGSTVALSWLAPVAGGTPTGYRVEAGTSPGAATFALPLGVTTSTAVKNVQTGRYYLRVRALNAAGVSSPSKEIAVSVGCSRRPGAPQLFSAVNGRSVVFSWQDPDGCSNTAYQLAVGATPGAADLATVSTGSDTMAATAAPGTYFARVRSVSDAGVSDQSEEVTIVVPPHVCAPPAFPLTLGGAILGRQVTVWWSSSQPAAVAAHDAQFPLSFTLDVGTASGRSDLGSIPLGRQLSFTTPAPPGTYFVRVRAHDSCGAGRPSNEVRLRVQ